MWISSQKTFLTPRLTFILLLTLTLTLTTRRSGACELESEQGEARQRVREVVEDEGRRLIQYSIRVRGYSRRFWRQAGGDWWFRPWVWFRVKGPMGERMLLLYDYYYGLLMPFMSVGSTEMTLSLSLSNDTGQCLARLSALQLESKLRRFLYYDLKNETERLTSSFDDSIRVCSRRIRDFSGWGRVVYHCCWRNDAGEETCSDVSEDSWVWALRVFLVVITILLFLYFPMLIPRGYLVYTFSYYPPDQQSFNLVLTKSPQSHLTSPLTTVLPAARWRRMRKLAAEVSKLQPDVIHKVTVKKATYECGMDRLLSETSSPVGMFKSLFDALVRLKLRHSDPLETCCNSPICGDMCLRGCVTWRVVMGGVRTVGVLMLLALPALPLLYALSADGLMYQEVAALCRQRGLHQSYNFYPGSIGGKVVVSLLSLLYVLHGVLVVVDGCHDQNLAREYSQLLQVTHHNASLTHHIRTVQRVLHKLFWPVQKCGVLAVPLSILLLCLMPLLLTLYLLCTSPVPKLLLHAFHLLCGSSKVINRHRKAKRELRWPQQVENALFVVTLVAVFAVLTLALNLVLHVLVVLMVQVLVDLATVLQFLTVLVLLLVYVRDSFRVVNTTYQSHLVTVLRHVLAVEAEDIKREADKDPDHQENKVFKIVPQTSPAPDPGTVHSHSLARQPQKAKRLFFMKNDQLRMRTRSLVLFLDKHDIPYIPKKFLFHTACMDCPGSPGRLEEAYLRSLGGFLRVVLFLLGVMLVVQAYADTHFVSTTSQFFALLFTGAIPLLLRYFLLKPAAVMKVDTATLRFQTQMDDATESFTQSWAVDDLLLSNIQLPSSIDTLYDAPRRLANLPPLPPMEQTLPPSEPNQQPANQPTLFLMKPATSPSDLPQTPDPTPDPITQNGGGRVNYMADETYSSQNITTWQQQDPSATRNINGFSTVKAEQRERQTNGGSPESDPELTRMPGNVAMNAKRERTINVDVILDLRGMEVDQVKDQAQTAGSTQPTLPWKKRSRITHDSHVV